MKKKIEKLKWIPETAGLKDLDGKDIWYERLPNVLEIMDKINEIIEVINNEKE